MVRNPPQPEALAEESKIPGIPNARFWGDEPPQHLLAQLERPSEELKARYPALAGVQHNYLAISGGGANGAFGAGFLSGWTDTGTRPEFTFVTGISTGALTAPLAFLGPDWDPLLEEIFTRYSTKDLIRKRTPFAALTADALVSTEGLKAIIDRIFDERMLSAIASEWLTKGRPLLIGTTNLYALRPVLWRIQHIAASGEPSALALVRNVLLASASLPIAFPPVRIEVEAAGRRYDEMHIDGGAVSQVFLYPPELSWDLFLKKLNVPSKPNVYLIRNSRLKPHWNATKPRVLPIALQTLTSLIRTQGIGDMFRVYLSSQRDGMNFHMVNIPDSFDFRPKEQFDQDYMRKLFDVGRQLGRSKNPWYREPPGFSTHTSA
ncbi:MAG: patatin-like phospholipase family protein [Rhodospirillales bacterium]|nr:patatin-like phospholipase family protein [Rhodospirillales bacterium]